MKAKRIIIILSAVLTLLLIPFVAMQFSEEVDWGVLDFTVMGILLFGTGLLCDLVLRKIKSVRNRIIVIGAILLGFFLIWAELAVGVFGSVFAGS